MTITNIFEYYEQEIKSTITTLYEDGYLNNDLSKGLVIFNNEDLATNKNPINFKNGINKTYINVYYNGGVINTDTPMNTEVKIMKLEVFCVDEYREDITVLLNEIATNNRNIVTSIDSTDVKIHVENAPITSEKETIQGYDVCTSELSLFLLVYNNSVLGNNIILKIENVEIPFSTITKSRVFETMADLQKRETTKHFTNLATFQIKIDGFFDKTNSSLISLFSVLNKNSNFGKSWAVKTERDDTIEVNDVFTIKEINDEETYNQQIKYSITFITAYEV